MTGQQRGPGRDGATAVDGAGGEAAAVLLIGKGWFPEVTGGLDRYLRDLLERLPRARALVVGQPDAGGRVEAVSAHDAPLAQRMWRLAGATWRQSAGADVIDAHFALYAFPGLSLNLHRGRPIVVHFQGPWANENVEGGDSSRLRLHARRALERSVYRRAEVAVTLTTAFKSVLVERYGVQPWRVRVIPPGVDLARFTPGSPEPLARAQARERLGLAADCFVACCVRRLVPRMGIGVLLEAWQLSEESGGLSDPAAASTPRQLLIAGDGPLRDDLAREVRGRGLALAVRVRGGISDVEVVDLYRAADVNVVPSVATEGFGLIVLEAAACGTPSIVTRVGGLPEAVAGLDDTLIVPAADAGELARRLTAAAGGVLPDRARVRDRVQANGWDEMAARNQEVYELARAGRGLPRRLRVVYLGHVARLSGAEIALVRMLAALPDVDAHVVLAEDGPLVQTLLERGVSVEVLALSERTRDLRRDRISARGLPAGAALDTAGYVARLARRLRALRPDIVHTNSLKAGIYGSLAARLAGIPVVWHVHDRIAPDYLGGSAAGVVRALVGALPDGVVANSQATRALLSRVPANTIVVSPPVYDDLSASRSRERLEDAPFTAGIVGRLAPWKGQHLFLEAFAAAFGGGDERAVVVGEALFGSDEEAYGEALRRLAERLGIAGRVDFRGFRDDVWAELAHIDVLVHASTAPEPYGQVVVEAMHAGVPVIASDAGAPSEIVTDGVDGLLYRMGDAGELAAALGRVRHDPALRERLAAAGRARSADFSPEAAAAALMPFYERVIAAQASRRRHGGVHLRPGATRST